MLCDLHIHSDNSFDGESSVRELCESAVEKGISVITVTDHMEAPEIRLGDRSVFGNMINQIGKSVADVEAAKALGCTRFVEFGPGKVLSGLIKKIDATLTAVNVSDLVSLEAALAALG